MSRNLLRSPIAALRVREDHVPARTLTELAAPCALGARDDFWTPLEVFGRGILAFGLLFAAPMNARALDADAGAEDPRAVARTLKAKADKAFVDGDFNAAIDYLQKAYDADPQPGFLANQGLILIRLGENETAAERFEAYLGTNPPPDKAQMALKHLERYRASVAFVTYPPGARVFLDGEQASVGTAPIVIRMKPGRHVAELRLGGYQTTQARFAAERGLRTTIEFEMVQAEEGGVDAASTVRSIGDDGGGWGRRQWGWLLVGTGALAGAASGFFLLETFGAVDERDTARNEAEFEDRHEAAGDYLRAYYGAGGLAVAALGVGVYLLLTADAGEDDASTPKPVPGGLEFTF